MKREKHKMKSTISSVPLEEWRKRLAAFCYPANPRLVSPFVRDGVLYATDGRIVLSVAGFVDVPDDVPPAGRFPDAASIVDPLSRRTMRWTPIPDVPHCAICNGLGIVPAKVCDECCGTGSSECSHCGSIVDCDACDGDGKWPSSRCDDCPDIDLGDKGWASDMVRSLKATEEWGGAAVYSRDTGDENMVAVMAGPHGVVFGAAMLKLKAVDRRK